MQKRFRFILILSMLIIGRTVDCQNLEWAFNLGNEAFDEATEMALDEEGNIYVIGSFQEKVDFDPGPAEYFLQSKGYTDVFFAKYDPSGNLIWAKNVGGLYWDFGYTIHLDSDGHVLISGNYRNTSDFDPGPNIYNLESNGWYNIFLAKYTNEGAFIWAHGFGSSANDIGRSVQSDTAGNIYLTGYIKGSADFDPSEEVHMLNCNGENDFYIAKYTSAGDFLWAHSFGNSKYDGGNEVAIDLSGNVYITGFFQNTLDFDPGEGVAELETNGNADLFYAKYDTDGNYVWAKSIGWWDGESGNCIKLDTSGNLYLAGTFGDSGGPVDFDPGDGIAHLQCIGAFDLFIAKYNNNGDYIWAKSIGAEGFEKASELDINAAGHVFVVGSFQHTVDFDPGTGTKFIKSNGDYDAFVLELDAAGNFIWVNTIGDYGWDQSLGISSGDSNQIYISGHFEGTTDFGIDENMDLVSNGDRDIFLARYEMPCFTSYNEIHACLGNEHFFPDGTTSDTSMIHVIIYESKDNCDSLVVYSLVFDTLYQMHEYVELCEGGICYLPDGNAHTESGVYTSVLVAQDGCDSIIITTLEILPDFQYEEFIEICEGSFYTFPDGDTGMVSMTHISLLISEGGCDSIITTNLEVYPLFDSLFVHELCAGESISLSDGSQISSDTTITFLNQSVYGCDSMETHQVVINSFDQSVSMNNGILSVSDTLDAYQWLDCQNGMTPIEGETGPEYTPAQDGSYSVQLMLGNCSVITECEDFIFSSTEKLTVKEFLVYPNPNYGDLCFHRIFNGELIIYNLQGQPLVRKYIDHTIQCIDIKHLPAGIYLLKLSENGFQSKIVKLIILQE